MDSEATDGVRDNLRPAKDRAGFSNQTNMEYWLTSSTDLRESKLMIFSQ